MNSYPSTCFRIFTRFIALPAMLMLLSGCFSDPEVETNPPATCNQPNVLEVTANSVTLSVTSPEATVGYFELSPMEYLPGEDRLVDRYRKFRQPHERADFTTTIRGLVAGRSYSFQASSKISNSGEETHAVRMKFTFGMPRVINPTIGPISASSALLGGTVTDAGSSDITQRGIVLLPHVRRIDGILSYFERKHAQPDPYPDPRIDSPGVVRLFSTGTTGAFTVETTGLTPGTEYIFRAFATNNADTAYSPSRVFRAGAPIIENPTVAEVNRTTVTAGADVTHEGAAAVTECGIIYSKYVRRESNGDPDKLSLEYPEANIIRTTGATGAFSLNASDLEPNNLYYFRAYATNAYGTSYADILPLFTSGLPIVINPTVTDVTPTTATLGGDVSTDGGAAITERGVVFSTTESDPDPQIGDESVTKMTIPGTTGVFTLIATYLEPGTHYTFRTYATNVDGTGYSDPLTFETSGTPLVTGANVVTVGQTTATLAADVTADSGHAIIERGILLAAAEVNGTPRLGGEGVIQLVSVGEIGPFTVDATGLTADTEYAFCAYATNSQGTTYSAVVGFTTFGADGDGGADGTDGSDRPGEVDAAYAGSLAGSDPFSKINATAVQPDGKTLLVGRFSQVNGVARSNIARLNADGTLDTGFTTSVPNEASCVAVLPDGKILIGGQFWSTVNGEPKGSFTQLNADGTLDTTFVANVQGWILATVPLADGKILIGGTLSQIDGASFNSSLARLNADGSLDTTFGGSTDYGFVSAIAAQPDGKILVGGVFSSLNSNPNYGRFGRFNADGSLDTGFIPGAQPNVFPNSSVEVIAVQPDGKILIGGYFSSYQGVDTAGLARLNPNGTLDEGFNVGPREADPFIRSLALQADGKILVGGDFKRFGGKTAKNIVRLNRNGTLDRSFNVGAGPDSFVHSVALQGDGLVVVAGEFQNINGQPAALIGRLENGPSVSSLQPVGATGANWMLDGSAPEVAGNVLFELSTDDRASWTPLGAGVVTPGGWNLTGLSLPASGWLRVSGSTQGGIGNGSSGRIQQIEGFPARLPLVTSPSAVIEKNPLRATISGTVESEGDRPVTERGVVFSPTTTNDAPMLGGQGVGRITADTAGAGAFTVVLPNLVEGVYVSCRAYAISARGTSYSDVVTVLAPRPPTVSIAGVASITDTTVTMYADLDADPGAIILDRGFVYTTLSGADRLAGGTALIRQSVAGTTAVFETPITGLMPGTQYWFAAYVESDLGIVYSLAFSRFTTVASAPAEEMLARESLSESEGGIGALAASGMVDADYDPDVDAGAFYVQALATQPDGSTIVAGTFSGIGGAPRYNVARVNADGSVDPTFTTEANGIVYSAVVQDDGKILLGGLFTTVNGESRNGIARLNANGTLESLSTFNPGTGADNLVYAMALQPNGKILIGGLFQNYNGAPRSHIARLNADGSLESSTTFNADTGTDGAVYTLGLQSDGKILLGGDFLNVNDTGRVRMARLHPNGSLDTTFDPGAGANDKVSCVMVQPDGQILVGGYFTTFGGSSANRLARLNPDGSLESSTTFNPGTGADHRVYSIALQMDGRILIGGLFQNYDGTPRSRIARLEGDGSLDSTFNPGSGTDGEVDAIALEVDGGILIGGQFTMVDGVSRSHMTRYGNDTATSTMNVVDATHLHWTRTGPGPEVSTVVFQLSTNGGTTWSTLGDGVRVGDDWALTGLALPPTGTVRVVGRTTGGFLSASSGLVGATAELSFSAGDIAVEQFGNGLVASGSTISMGESVLSDSSDLTFTVSNTGAGLLAGVQLTLSGVDATEFSIPAPPAITVAAGGSTQFTVRFTPANQGDKTATLRIASNDPDESPYTLLLTGTGTLPTEPLWVNPPVSQLVMLGEPALFAPTLTGMEPFRFQWLRDGRTLAGSTAQTLSFPSVRATDARSYSLRATNDVGQAESPRAWLGVVMPVPEAVQVAEGSRLRLTASVRLPAGTTADFVWLKDGDPVPDEPRISGRTGPVLTMLDCTAADSGAYECVISMFAPDTTSARTTPATTVSVLGTPVVTLPALPPVYVNQPFTATVSSSQGPVRYSATGLPPGFQLDPVNGQISGAATAAKLVKNTPAAYSVRFTAANLAGTSAPVQVDWVVLPVPDALAGTYEALVERHAGMNAPGDASEGLGGVARIVITAKGTFSGTLTMSGQKIPLKGLLTPSDAGAASASAALPRKKPLPPLNLTFDLDAATGSLSGLLEDGAAFAPLEGWRAVADTALAGTHNLALLPETAVEADSTFPQGSGFAVAKITSKGTVTWSGKTAEGTKITGSALTCAAGYTPFHQPLDAGTASVQGWLEFGSDTASGLLSWFKAAQPEKSKSRLYRTGFPLHYLEARGGRYIPPATGQVIFDLNDATFTFSEGGLPQPFGVMVAIQANHKVTLAANDAALVLKLTPKTGLFTASFVVPDEAARKATGAGLFVPGLEEGAGYFLLPASTEKTSAILSGRLSISP